MEDAQKFDSWGLDEIVKIIGFQSNRYSLLKRSLNNFLHLISGLSGLSISSDLASRAVPRRGGMAPSRPQNFLQYIYRSMQILCMLDWHDHQFPPVTTHFLHCL